MHKEGLLSEEKLNGYFEKTLDDDVVYKGHWKNGKQHGVGFLVYPYGKTIKGEWDDGKLVKWSNYVAPKRKIRATYDLKVNPGILF